MNDNPNPKHSKLLNLIPGELHPLIIPVLKEWDQGVNDQFQNIRNEYKEYEVYKPLIDAGIDPTFAQQSAALVQQLQENPKDILEQINQQWDLGYVSADQVQQQTNNLGNEGLEDLDMNDDFFSDPRVKAMADSIEAMKQTLDSRVSAETEKEQLAAFEAELDTLEKATTDKNLPFDRTFVTALIAQGFEPDVAVSTFHQTLVQHGVKVEAGTTTEQQIETDSTPPVILGGNPSGSGLPDGQVKFGALSKNDLNSTVEQLLQQQFNSNQG